MKNYSIPALLVLTGGLTIVSGCKTTNSGTNLAGTGGSEACDRVIEGAKKSPVERMQVMVSFGESDTRSNLPGGEGEHKIADAFAASAIGLDKGTNADGGWQDLGGEENATANRLKRRVEMSQIRQRQMGIVMTSPEGAEAVASTVSTGLAALGSNLAEARASAKVDADLNREAAASATVATEMAEAAARANFPNRSQIDAYRVGSAELAMLTANDAALSAAVGQERTVDGLVRSIRTNQAAPELAQAVIGAAMASAAKGKGKVNVVGVERWLGNNKQAALELAGVTAIGIGTGNGGATRLANVQRAYPELMTGLNPTIGNVVEGLKAGRAPTPASLSEVAKVIENGQLKRALETSAETKGTIARMEYRTTAENKEAPYVTISRPRAERAR